MHICMYFVFKNIFFFFLSRSGKSSIQKVVFHKVSPNETLFLESTNKIVKDGKFVCVIYIRVIDFDKNIVWVIYVHLV